MFYQVNTYRENRGDEEGRVHEVREGKFLDIKETVEKNEGNTEKDGSCLIVTQRYQTRDTGRNNGGIYSPKVTTY